MPYISWRNCYRLVLAPIFCNKKNLTDDREALLSVFFMQQEILRNFLLHKNSPQG